MTASERARVVTTAVFLVLGGLLFLLGDLLDSNYTSTFLELLGAGLVLVGVVFGLLTAVAALFTRLRHRGG